MLSVLFSLLIFVFILAISFWLVRLVCAGIPGCPPFVAPIVIAIIALVALYFLFGNVSGESFRFGVHHFSNRW